MINEVKEYKVTNEFGIRCLTYTDYFGNKSYEVQEVMLGLPWLEITSSSGVIYDKDQANNYFKNLVTRIKRYESGYLGE